MVTWTHGTKQTKLLLHAADHLRIDRTPKAAAIDNKEAREAVTCGEGPGTCRAVEEMANTDAKGVVKKGPGGVVSGAGTSTITPPNRLIIYGHPTQSGPLHLHGWES